MFSKDTIQETFRHFFPDGHVLRIERESAGTINHTCKIHTATGTYILQEISRSVFGERIDALEYNYRLFLNEYEKCGAEKAGFDIPRWIPDKTGKMIYTDADGRHWRIYKYLQGKTFDLVSVPDKIELCANAVSSMHFLLSRITAVPREVIAHYHDIRHYINEFITVISVKKRDPECEETIEKNIQFMLNNCLFKRNGMIHGDTKIGNILYNPDTANVSFLDFDTFFYSSKLIDIGDSVRSVANEGGDIPDQVVGVCFDRLACIKFLRSYLSSPLCTLSSEEIAQLPYAIMRIPFELGLRFYTDYLKGNQYFTTAYEEQNLQRAKCQFKLYQDIEADRISLHMDNLATYEERK